MPYQQTVALERRLGTAHVHTEWRTRGVDHLRNQGDLRHPIKYQDLASKIILTSDSEVLNWASVEQQLRSYHV